MDYSYKSESWVYGAASPALRQLTISTETRYIDIFAAVSIPDYMYCDLNDAAGRTVAWVEYGNTGDDRPARIELRPGSIRAGSRAAYQIICTAGLYDSSRLTFNLIEGPGVGEILTLRRPELSGALVSSALATNYCEGESYDDCYGDGADPSVKPGDIVQIRAQPGAFRVPGQPPKITVSLYSSYSSVTAAGLSPAISGDGSVLGFTIPGGFPNGTLQISVKSVTTVPGNATTAKYDEVARWDGQAVLIADPTEQTLTAAPVPTVSGSAAIGSTVTANPGQWSPGPVALSYRWEASGSPISGASNKTFTVTEREAGRYLSVIVTGTRSGYRSVTRESVQVGVAPLKGLSVPVPTISGDPIVGTTLTANPGTWTPTPVSTVVYWWLEISSHDRVWLGSGPTYQVKAADVGYPITLEVVGTKAGYLTSSVAAVTGPVVTVGKLTVTPIPQISGTARVGQTLRASPGTWQPQPVTLRYQWKRAGQPIPGATAATYKLTNQDKYAKVTVAVTGSKPNYTPVTKTSASRTTLP